MATDNEEQNGKNIATIISFGLAAAGLATIIQLATLSKLDRCLFVTVYGFALAIPILVTSGLAVHPSSEVKMDQPNSRAFLFLLYVVGILASVIAVAGLFFHFSTFAGMAYVAVALFCAIVARKIETVH